MFLKSICQYINRGLYHDGILVPTHTCICTCGTCIYVYMWYMYVCVAPVSPSFLTNDALPINLRHSLRHS